MAGIARTSRAARLGISRSVLWHSSALVVVAAMVVPFLWMASTSLESLPQMLHYPPTLVPPRPEWHNYVSIFQDMPLARYLLNTVVIVGLSIVGQLLTCSLSGYAFARLRFTGSKALFVALMIALIVPPEVIVVPQFLLFKTVGGLNTYVPLVLPWWLVGAIGTFLFRQFFRSVPRALEEAAMIDGGKRWQVFRYVYLPLARPISTTVAIFTMVTQWNNLIFPVVFLQSNSLLPITVGITSFQSQYSTHWNLLMAATLLSILPMLLLYAFGQRYFVQGMATRGVEK